MIKLPSLIFGLTLIAIWAVLTKRRPSLQAPSDLSGLQANSIAMLENASIRTSLLTAGLVSIALGLS